MTCTVIPLINATTVQTWGLPAWAEAFAAKQGEESVEVKAEAKDTVIVRTTSTIHRLACGRFDALRTAFRLRGRRLMPGEEFPARSAKAGRSRLGERVGLAEVGRWGAALQEYPKFCIMTK